MVKQLEQATSGKAHVAYHSETGYVSFIGTDFQNPVPMPSGLPSYAAPEDAARAFLSTYGKLFGLINQKQELTVLRKTDYSGRSFVRFQQVHKGIPILGGELVVQTDAGRNIISANGEFLPGLEIDVTPKIDAAAASVKAIEVVAKIYGMDTADLVTTQPELWIYNPVILKPSLNFNTLVWRMDVTPGMLLPVRELVLVDAYTGAIALHFNQIDSALNRSIYDNNNNASFGLPGNGPMLTEGGTASAVQDVNLAYDYSGDTYDFYSINHGRDSLDNAGMQLISTVRYCPDASHCPYSNAFWDGRQMVYGNGYASADDVVGHELTHGVTEKESHLFYYYQSGAINESLSDVWGEFVDQVNGAGTDTPAVKWLMGEDVPGGAIRSMSNPPLYGDPDRMRSTIYTCDTNETDSGGVHTNSGVNNKAVYLMTDGGTFNGYTVTGLGITKVAKIYYEAQTNLLLSASDYNDLYNALQQACTNLTGTSGIISTDCLEVTKALNAVEMGQQPASCAANAAPVCPSGQSPVNLFFDDLENPAGGNWAPAALSGANGWYYPQNAHTYTDFDATYATSGQYNIWGDDISTIANYYIGMTVNVFLPSGITPYMHFNHAYGFEDGFDGGVLEYSTDSGAAWSDAKLLFINNGYNGTISNSWGNPLGGQQAFTGESNGYYSSRLDLTSFSGLNVRFRFRIGTDSSVDDYGWFIDDVRIYACDPAVSPPSVPSGLVTTAMSTSQIDIVWQDNATNEIGFWIERKNGVNGTYYSVSTAGADVTAFSDTGLLAGTTYYYRVRAYNSTGISAFSNEMSATTASPPPSSGGGDGGGGGKKKRIVGCFIATAAYGSYMANEVVVLRDFRDKYLLTNIIGTLFVELYYAYSPPIADYIRTHEAMRTGARYMLTPLVYGAKYPGVSGLILLAVFAVTALTIRTRRSKK